MAQLIKVLENLEKRLRHDVWHILNPEPTLLSQKKEVPKVAFETTATIIRPLTDH